MNTVLRDNALIGAMAVRGILEAQGDVVIYLELI